MARPFPVMKKEFAALPLHYIIWHALTLSMYVCVCVCLCHNNVCHQRGLDIKCASVSPLNTRLGHGMFSDSRDVSH